MAQQEQPIRRRVALKVIKAGLDTQQVIARFEAERQALALMEHQNIARVLDAGTTDEGQLGMVKTEPTALAAGTLDTLNQQVRPEASACGSQKTVASPSLGRPYFVMELVQGISITRYCDDNRLPVEQRLSLFASVCDAIQHAHQKGIVHRDIKPSNVLVALYDGVPVPKVIDFGLAKALQHQTKLTDRTLFTEFGQIVGTLQYMSPEQAEMNALDIDTRTDIYSLGVLLYELLTGSTPIDQETVRNTALLSVLESIREQEPPRPSVRLSSSADKIAGISVQRSIDVKELTQMLRGDLDWIVMKSIEKDRERRYPSAAKLGEDVRHFLLGDVVDARPPSRLYRLRKFAGKNRLLVISLLAIGFSLILSALVSLGYASRAHVAKQEARTSAEIAKQEGVRANENAEKSQQLAIAAQAAREQERLLRIDAQRSEKQSAWNNYTARMSLAGGAFSDGSFGRVEHLLDETKPQSGGFDFRGWEWDWMRHRLDQRQPVLSSIPAIRNFDWHQPSNRIAANFADGKIRIWDMDSEKITSEFKSPGGGFRLTWSDDGSQIAMTIDQKKIVFLDPNSGEELKRFQASDGGGIDALAWRPGTNEIAVAVWNRGAMLFDASSGKLTKRIDRVADDDYCKSIAFTSDGKRIAVGGTPGSVRVFDLDRDQLLWKHENALGVQISSLAWNADDTLLAIGALELGRINVCDHEGTLLWRYVAHPGSCVNDLQWLDEKKLVSAGEDQFVKIWSVDEKRLINKFHLNQAPVESVRVDASGDRLAIFSVGFPIKTVETSWIASSNVYRRPHSAPIQSISWNDAGDRVLTSSWDRSAAICETIDGDILHRFNNSAPVKAAIWSPSNREVWVLLVTGTLHVYDCETWKRIKKLEHPGEANACMALSSNGQQLAVAHDKSVSILNVADWKTIRTLQIPHTLHNIHWSPDDSMLVTLPHHLAPILMDAETGEAIKRPSLGESTRAIDWNRNGTVCATTSTEGILNYYRFNQRNELLHSTAGHLGPVWDLDWSHSNGRIASCGVDGTIRIWDESTGDLVTTISVENASPLRCVTWSQDGSGLAASDDSGKLWLFKIPSDSKRPESLTFGRLELNDSP